MATKKKKRKRKAKHTVGESLAAKVLAKIYRRIAKAENVYSRPWRTDVPLESLAVFSCFVETHRLVVNLGADPKDFVRSQFENWNGPPSKRPKPNQLFTQGAVNRWNEWFEENRAVTETTIKSRRRNGSHLKQDAKRLRILKQRTGLSTKRLLKRDPGVFAKETLKKYGVWDAVRDAWMERNDAG